MQSKYVVILVYRPLSSLDGDSDDLMHLITDFTSKLDVVVMGGYNQKSIKWNSDELKKIL